MIDSVRKQFHLSLQGFPSRLAIKKRWTSFHLLLLGLSSFRRRRCVTKVDSTVSKEFPLAQRTGYPYRLIIPREY
jgi:hypothetical protein